MKNGDIFITDKIFDYYCREYWSRNVDYVEFIDSKHLGIEAVYEDRRLGKRCNYCDTYKITDKHVWLISKIRLGL